MIEHSSWDFPDWLAPVQVKVIPVSHSIHDQYDKKIKKQLKEVGIRVEYDSREEKLGYKMREAQLKKVPYILVVGDKEMENSSVQMRRHGEEHSCEMQLEDFISKLQKNIEVRGGAKVH